MADSRGVAMTGCLPVSGAMGGTQGLTETLGAGVSASAQCVLVQRDVRTCWVPVHRRCLVSIWLMDSNLMKSFPLFSSYALAPSF